MSKSKLGKRFKTAKDDRPQPPSGLTGDAVQEWDRICHELDDLDRLCQVDRAILALYIKVWSTFAVASAHVAEHGPAMEFSNGNCGLSPHYKVMKDTSSQLRALLHALGLTPEARNFDNGRADDDEDLEI